MDDWFSEYLQSTRKQLEAIAQVVEKQVDETINDLFEASDRLADDIDQAIAPALDNLDQWEAEVSQRISQQLNDWLPEKPSQAIEDFEQQVDQWTASTGQAIGQALRPLEQTVKPVINEHQTCIGCRNYHGEAYGDSSQDSQPEMLVCGIHPFGYDADQCPDWESTWEAERKD